MQAPEVSVWAEKSVRGGPSMPEEQERAKHNSTLPIGCFEEIWKKRPKEKKEGEYAVCGGAGAWQKCNNVACGRWQHAGCISLIQGMERLKGGEWACNTCELVARRQTNPDDGTADAVLEIRTDRMPLVSGAIQRYGQRVRCICVRPLTADQLRERGGGMDRYRRY